MRKSKEREKRARMFQERTCLWERVLNNGEKRKERKIKL